MLIPEYTGRGRVAESRRRGGPCFDGLGFEVGEGLARSRL